jgi:acyl-homoserine lactone synthase
MIHVVTAENRKLYEKELLEHHRIRYEIYVRENKWKNLKVENGRESDQFDNDDAIYILAIENGHVVGGSRFVPTIKPHLLNDVFPSLADVKGVPRSPDIFEWTRLFAVAEKRDRITQSGSVTGKILCGGLEFLLGEEATGFTIVTEAFWLARTHSWGWKLSPLGMPALIDGEWLVASYVVADFETLQTTRRRYGIEESVLIRNGITRPAIRSVA